MGNPHTSMQYGADYSGIYPNTHWGNTFHKQRGGALSTASAISIGGIDYPNLNKRRFSNNVEITEFYQIIKDFVLSRLGFPVVRVELTDHQIATAIDEAVSKLDYHSPRWCTQLMTFETSAGVNGYTLPPLVMNNLQYVVYKKTLLAVAQQQGTLEFDFFIKYFQDNFLFSDFQIGDYLVMTMHLEQIRMILSREGSWDVIDNRMLFLHPNPTEREEVVVEFRALNSETLHPYFLNWLQRYSLAVSKGILGTIRGKYDMLPSPQGGARLNGALLSQESVQEQEKLLEELLSEMEEPPVFTAF